MQGVANHLEYQKLLILPMLLELPIYMISPNLFGWLCLTCIVQAPVIETDLNLDFVCFHFERFLGFLYSFLVGCIYTGLVQAHIFVNVNLGSNFFHPFSYPVMESDFSYDLILFRIALMLFSSPFSKSPLHH